MKSALVLALAAFLLLWDLGGRPLYDPDEGRYAQIAHEMVQSGDWLLPRLSGVAYLDKPPLLYWLEAAGISVLGANEWGVRALLACVSLVGVLLVLLLGRAMFDERTGVLAAAVLATSPLYLGVGRVLLTDGLLTVALLGAVLCLWRVHCGQRGALGIWLCLALSMLAKGPIGPVLFGASAGLFWLSTRPRLPLRKLRWGPGLLLFGLISLPWFVLVERAVPGYLRFFLLEQNLQGLVSGEIHHPHAWYYSFVFVLAGFAPWSLLLPMAPRFGWKEPAVRLLLLWSAVVFAVFTLSVSKLATYFLPMYPALALIVARGLLSRGARFWPAALFSGVAVLVPPLAWWVLARLEPVPLFSSVALALALLAGGTLLCGLLFRLGQPLRASVAYLAALALALVVASPEVARFDRLRSPRGLLRASEARLARCEPLLSFSFPTGMAEFYLDRSVVLVAKPRYYLPGRRLEPESGRFLGWEEMGGFLRAHPNACLLSRGEKLGYVRQEVGAIEILASDGTHVIVAAAGSQPASASEQQSRDGAGAEAGERAGEDGA